MFKKSFFILGTLFFCLALATSFAADLEPYLQTLLNQGASTEFFSVLLDLKDQVDMAKLKSEFKATKADRATSHKIVIEALKQKAQSSQTGLLNYLQTQKEKGEVEDYKAFWIANLVWVKATKREVEKLATRGDVETVYAQPKPEIIKPVEVVSVAGSLVGVEPGIKAIKADSAWGLGYEGAGRLLCNIDTGVNGNHVALAGRWRGVNGGTVAESWFDPVYKSTFPADNIGGVAGHGTGTMGVMCGASLVTNDTVGVAIEAQWIAARAIDIGATWSVEIEALQWASDPDGNPNTITDVPDAVNNSWGIPTANVGCLPLYWKVIDNLEAAGAVVIFAAGNEGTAAQTIRNPANRATTDFNCFAVGSVNSSNVISGFSSRGPSDCDGVSIKPEVVAPGELIRTSNRFGGYTNQSGTSFSAPHVAGAVAILRQVNPNATPDEIKRALMVSATDLGAVGQDNAYGWGIINVKRAIDSLPAVTVPRIFVFTIELSDNNDSIPDPGDALSALITVKNTGLAATNVYAILTSTTSSATVTQDSAFYGTIPRDGFSVNFSQQFIFQVSPSAVQGEKLTFNLQMKGDGGYEENWPLVFYVTAKPVRSLVDVDTGNVIFTISNFGQYGLSNISITPLGGKGFIYPKVGGTDDLFEAALLIGTDISHVSDGARDWTGFMPDSDFAVAPQGDMLEISPGREGSQQTISIFNDEKAESPLDLKIVQRTFAFSDTMFDDFVIFSYTAYNEGASPVSNLRIGSYTDWDLPSLQDFVGLNRSNNIGYMWHGGSNSRYRGIAVLDTVGVTSFKALVNDSIVYDGISDTEKYVWMSEGFIDTAKSSADDGSMTIASGPYSIAPGDSITSIMAFVAANNLTNLLIFADRARIKATELFPMATCTHRAGDVTGDGKVLLSDIIVLINFLFKSGPTPNPFCRGDVNFDNAILLPDIVYLVNFIFRNGPRPVPYNQCCIGT